MSPRPAASRLAAAALPALLGLLVLSVASAAPASSLQATSSGQRAHVAELSDALDADLAQPAAAELSVGLEIRVRGSGAETNVGAWVFSGASAGLHPGKLRWGREITAGDAFWYDPTSGLFLSEDPVQGDLFDPSTLHVWGYANGDPVSFVDPHGEWGQLALLGAAIVVGSAWGLRADDEVIDESGKKIGGANLLGPLVPAVAVVAPAAGAVGLGVAGAFQGAGMADDAVNGRAVRDLDFNELAGGFVLGGLFAPLGSAPRAVRGGVALTGGGLGAVNGIDQYRQGNYVSGTLSIGLGAGAVWGMRSDIRALRGAASPPGKGVAQGPNSARLGMPSRIARRALEPIAERVALWKLPYRQPKSLGVRLSRFVVTARERHPGVADSPVGAFLKRAPVIRELRWEQGHVFIQRSWFRAGGPNQWYPNNQLAQIGLARLGNAGWNLIPMPRAFNGWIGSRPWATATVGFGVAGSVGAAGVGGYYVGTELGAREVDGGGLEP